MTFYTYLLTDPRTNIPFYVGKGRDNRAWDRNGRNAQVRGRLDKLEALGLKPIVEVAYTPTEKEAFWFETDLIASLGRKDLKQGSLLNHTNGGDGSSGTIISEETRQRMRIVKLRENLSDETLNRMRRASKNRSLETRKKISVSLINNVHSLGYKHTEVTKEKMRIAQRTRRAREK